MSQMISIAAFRIQSPLDGLARAFRTMRRRKATARALNALSAVELADIGIERSDIPNVARKVS